MAKILLVNPVVREEDDPRHVPYGLALVARIAMEHGHQVQVYDANAWRAPESILDEVMQADDWDVIATGGITTTYGYVKKVVRAARRLCPRAVIVLGGGLVTSLPFDIMRLMPEADVAVIGEAFQTFPELMAEVDRGERDHSKVRGVAYHDGKGRVRLSPERPLLEDIDTLPYPAWELFPLHIYFKNSMVLFSEEGMLAKKRLDINASYGCSLICRYCFHLGTAGDMKYVETPDGGQDVTFTHERTIRYHSPRYVVDMVLYLRRTYGIDFVGFLDENLMTMDQYSRRKWMKEICRLWVEDGLQPSCVRDGVPHDERCQGVHWSGTSHATLVTEEALRAMRQAGCSHLVYGYESFSKRVLKTVGKGATPETNERSLKLTLAHGIRPIPNQIIGFPAEDFDSIKDNMIAWKRLGLKVKPFFCTPYPGSEWFQTYRKRILEQYDGDMDAFLADLGDATRVTAVISEKFDAVELYGLRELMVLGDLRRVERYERERVARDAAVSAARQKAPAPDAEVDRVVPLDRGVPLPLSS